MERSVNLIFMYSITLLYLLSLFVMFHIDKVKLNADLHLSKEYYFNSGILILVNKDPNPQWRRILWSPDCTMLAFSHSDGKLDFYDLIGVHMFSIANVCILFLFYLLV